MSIINVLVGLPGSGKDYYAKSKANSETDVIISSDDIRAELYGSAECQDHPEIVFFEMFKRTCAAVREEKHIIYYNATNLNRKKRINLIKEFRKIFPDVTICATVITAPYDVCCKRNSERDRVVPDFAMERMYKSFNVPSTAEGFSYVIVRHNFEYNDNTLIYKLKISKDVDQDNQHHTMSVGDHCIAACDYITENEANIVEQLGNDWYEALTKAAMYHDIGKPFCKAFKNAKGEETNDAHFYNHDNVGAYDFLTYDCSSNNLTVALLINMHMIFYGDVKYQERMKEFYGDEFWTALEWLHKADQSAH